MCAKQYNDVLSVKFLYNTISDWRERNNLNLIIKFELQFAISRIEKNEHAYACINHIQLFPGNWLNCVLNPRMKTTRIHILVYIYICIRNSSPLSSCVYSRVYKLARPRVADKKRVEPTGLPLVAGHDVT